MIEYECPSCLHSFERYQSEKDTKEQGSCPHCGGEELLEKGPAQERVDFDWLRLLRKNRCSLSFG